MAMRDQRLWTWHVLAGLAILLLGGLHMTVMHLDDSLGLFSPAGGHAIDWANVAARAKHVGWMVTYVLLLGAGLFHGFYGLRNILFELGPGPGLKKAVSGVLVVGGLALFVIGTWAAWASFRLAGTL
jgi:succinate dehydrogenase hydrophobic anchor subunit